MSCWRSCGQAEDHEASILWELPEGLVYLPLEPPMAATRDEKILAAEVEELYAKIAVKCEDEKAAETTAKTKEERVKRIDEEMSRANPGNHLSYHIEEKLEAKLTKRREDCDMDIADNDATAPPHDHRNAGTRLNTTASDAASNTVNQLCDAIAVKAKHGGGRGRKGESKKGNGKPTRQKDSWVANVALQK